MTQFIGTMEVYPLNVNERAFSIAVLTLSFIVSAAFVSRITASMTRLQMIAEKDDRQCVILRRFLHNHSVSSNLTMRIMRSARHILTVQSRKAAEKDVELLGMISEPLLVEIHFEIYAPILRSHPFFERSSAASPAAMRKICHSAVHVLTLQPGDAVFHSGEPPKDPGMFFVMAGSMIYEFGAGTIDVPAGTWVCEAAVWVPWLHTGDLYAVSTTSVLALDAAKFQEITAKFQALISFTAAYAASFLEHLNEGRVSCSDVIDDFDWKACVDQAFQLSEVERRRSGAGRKRGSKDPKDPRSIP